MTTVDLYKKHKKGLVSRESFLYEVRRDSKLPFITNLTSYSDAVQILKNKGIISERMNEDFPEEDPYYQGMAANKAGIDYRNNPYSEDPQSGQYKEWHNGWMDAESEGQIAHDEDTFRRERGMDEAEGEGNKKTLYWIMIEKNGKRFYLGNAPYFSSEEEAHDYAKQHNVKNYSLKTREEMVDDDGRIIEAEEDYNPEGAWQEGYDAFMAGHHQEENPYEGDTTEHKNWDMGYEKAQHDGPGLDESNWVEKSSFDDFNVNDKVIVNSKEDLGPGTIIKMYIDSESGQRAAEIKFDKDNQVKTFDMYYLDPATNLMREGKELTKDTANPYEFRKGLTWELGYAMKPSPEWDDASISNQDIEKATKKVLKNLSNNANYYTELIANKGQKAKKEKEVKVEEDGMAKVKGVEKASANVQTSLGKKEKGKLRPEGVKEMKGSRKAFSKIKLMKENEMPVLDKKAAFMGKLKEALKTEISSVLAQQIKAEKSKLGKLYQQAGQQMANPNEPLNLE